MRMEAYETGKTGVRWSSVHPGYIRHGLFEGAKLRGLGNLKNVTFLEPVPKEAVPDYMSVTDVALVPLLKSETFKTVIPSKIFEAAAIRKPILLGVEGQAREIVEQYDAGVCFEPENEKDFLAAVIKLKEDRALYERLQEGCTRLAQDYDRKKLAKKMYECLKETASSY